MIAYHNNPEVKKDILAQLQRHYDADEIIKGRYWEEGRGCAIGCTIHSDNHVEYETRFGIPRMLARLEDVIFEGLPNGDAKEWPLRFMKAIRPGDDLSLVGWKFLHWLLTDKKVNPGINHPLVKEAVKQCADVLVPLTRGKKAGKSAARSAARSAAEIAESAAWGAAESAKSAARSAELIAARSAMSAARSAELSAESAAWGAAWGAMSAASAEFSAESAAWGAAWGAMSAESAEFSAMSAARSAARSAAWGAKSAELSAKSTASAAYQQMADKLIALISAAPKVKK